ncbi:alpha-N-acetylgalactosaminide alpha-2,6-sialyltransferase 5b [Siphateles boraxobius]|uniref:alpha-N-acetylgalactosaminide alpha-2,6-sialyltransferase 5b n=1 Tax=Siphateles boraxobius TaxID=180520 RepID=UPI004063C2BF
MKTRTRHGIILIGFVTVLTSLLFLYNSSFTDTPEDQIQSDGHQMNVLSQQTSYLEGYSSIIDHKVTYLRSANDSFFKLGNYDVKEDKTPPPQKKINAYFNTAGLAPPTDSRITELLENMPRTCLMRKAHFEWKRSNSWLSTGWFTMAIAMEVCDRIDVYGMIPPEFCKSPKPSVPYHYYEPAGPDECTMYVSHEQDQHGSHHRFITEKRVFAKWARMFNIHFYQPEWRPAPVAKNSTDST